MLVEEAGLLVAVATGWLSEGWCVVLSDAPVSLAGGDGFPLRGGGEPG
jgi:hypothetical protein